MLGSIDTCLHERGLDLIDSSRAEVDATRDLFHRARRKVDFRIRLDAKQLTVSAHIAPIAGEDRGPGPAIGDIRFQPDGSSTGGRITLADGRRRMAVGVDWLTGRVSVADVQ